MLSGAANEDSNMMDSFPDSDAAIVVSSSLVDLVPDQILLHIFSFLPDSWNELAFVCKKWWHVLRSRDLHLTSRPSVSAVSVAWIGGSLLLPQTSPLKIMLNNQARHQPTDYLSGTGRQLHFNATMRGILVDWLVEVKQEFNLREETLALNVALVDRYLSTTLVSLQRGRLQLLGLAALLIAAKFHEIYPPELADYAGIADNIYPREDIVAVESAVLNTLGFDVSILTLYDFATFFLSQASLHFGDQLVPGPVEYLANYLVGLAMLDYELALMQPSLVAFSIVVMSLQEHGLEHRGFVSENEILKCHSLRELNSCSQHLHSLACSNQAENVNAGGTTLQAVHDRFKDDKFGGVSLHKPPEALQL